MSKEYGAEFGGLMPSDRPHHHCGVAGVCLNPDSTSRSVDVMADILTHLQHRGPDGAGIAVLSTENPDESMGYSDVGRVLSVLGQGNLSGLPDGEYAIGHTRYPTRGQYGKNGRNALQPVYSEGVWLAQNGQFNFESSDGSPSDTYQAMERIKSHMFDGKTLEQAFVDLFEEVPDSAYSITAMHNGGVLAIRDPRGIHPLFYGYSEKVGGYLIASETPALTNLGVSDPRSVSPGHMMQFVSGNEPRVGSYVKSPLSTSKLCMLEAIYFARVDGQLEKKDVFTTRRAAGWLLAMNDEVDADIVVPVPDSARASAEGYSELSGIPYSEGILRVGATRSFLEPDQSSREKAVNHKLNIIPSAIDGKKIILIEDSIVRGTTLNDLVDRLKIFGALEVHVRIASPMVISTCEYGINIPTHSELLANQCYQDVNAMCRMIGADSLRFLSIAESRRALGGRLGKMACMKCFSGKSPKNQFEYHYPVFD